MKAIKSNIKISIGTILLFLALLACDSNKKMSDSQGNNIQIMEQDSIIISRAEVYLVKLDYEVTHTNKTYDRAWLVKLKVENLPIYYDSRIDFFIGDQRIPEYGGTEDGIYFRVYERDSLTNMSDAEIRYRLPRSKEIITSKQRLIIPELEGINIVNEKDLLKRKN